MDDKKDLTEYKFDESEGGTSLPATDTAATEQPSGLEENTISSGALQEMLSKFGLDKLDWKRLLKPGLIIFAILFLYIGFSFFSSEKSRMSEQEKISAQERAALEMQAMERQPEPITTPPVDMDAAQRMESQEALEGKIDKIAQYINESQEYMSRLSEQASKVDKEVSDINQSIEQLTMAIQKIFMDVEKLKNPPKKVVKKKAPVAYHVRAIVPGRVWLESVDGKNITLRVGDKLTGYGEVRLISPKQGMVVMSNGAVIQYGINDF